MQQARLLNKKLFFSKLTNFACSNLLALGFSTESTQGLTSQCECLKGTNYRYSHLTMRQFRYNQQANTSVYIINYVDKIDHWPCINCLLSFYKRIENRQSPGKEQLKTTKSIKRLIFCDHFDYNRLIWNFFDGI